MKYVEKTKPNEIEAVECTDENTQQHPIPDSGYEWPDWFNKAVNNGQIHFYDKPDNPLWGYLKIEVPIRRGDWVKKDSKGRLSVIMKSIFKQIYKEKK